MEPNGSSTDPKNDYKLSHGKVVQPLGNANTAPEPNAAVDLIRQKLKQLYNDEPNVKDERKEVEHLSHRSVHQQFMYDLSHSGKSLAQIQTEWHNYYVNLPDTDKHQVWQEFYAANHKTSPLDTPAHSVLPPASNPLTPPEQPKSEEPRTVKEVKDQLVHKVRSRAKPKNPHLRSLMFGLSSGFVMLAILMFGFFNERFVAPFVTPSRTVDATQLIIDPSNTATGAEPRIIIPKINGVFPVVYDEPSIQEDAVQAALERGVVHYATTPNPGELGNGVLFGHSSNNIFNAGKYKFAFALLRKLEKEDVFYIEKDGKRYVYKVFEKKIVSPSEVSVLNPGEKPATFTLITCDPPGTNLNRLVIVGEQISPEPSTNIPAPNQNVATATGAGELPGNAPSLWSRILDTFSR